MTPIQAPLLSIPSPGNHRASVPARQQLGRQPGFGLNWIQPIQMIMNPINNSRLVELCATDVLGFVVPRSLIDGYQRGVDAGREMFLREIMGTLTNVYLCGWVAWGMTTMMEHSKSLNPKGMGLNAWVDMGLLNHFAKETTKAMATAKTPQDLKRIFLNNILKQLKSSDGVPELAQYKKYYPAAGFLNKPVRNELVEKLMSGKQLGVVKNLDTEVAEYLSQTGLNENTVNKLREATTRSFLSERKVEGLYQLSRRQKARLEEEIIEKQAQILSQQTRQYREMLARVTRQSEQPFIEHLTNLAIDKGGVSNEVIFANKIVKDGKVVGFKNLGIGQRSVDDVFRKMKYFLREYLNPALTLNGNEIKGPMTEGLKNHLNSRLFTQAGENWFQRKWVPLAQDGLLPYIAKLKRSILIVPLAVTLFVGCTFAYINNWITQQKYNGRKFFPGEGVPRDVAHLKGGLF